MKYRYLGATGLPVARISLGTMTFGAAEWGCDKTTAFRILDTYIEEGGNFVDTADVYANNESERIIGEYLGRVDRDRLVIASKCFFPQGPSAGQPGASGLSRKYIVESCEKSLRRLKTDYIDLYYAHAFDPNTPPEEFMAAFETLVTQGKIRYLGCSNFHAWHFTLSNAVAARGARFVCGQHMYNLVHRDIEREILPACAAQGMSVVVWSPLAGGLLTGKYSRSAEPQEGTRLHHRRGIDVPRFWHERGFDAADRVAEIADEAGIPRAQAALGWILRESRVASVITGVRTVEQLKKNLVVAEWDLPDDVFDRLTAATQPAEGYLEQNLAHSTRAAFGNLTIG
jgi:aryl-alcohol dehydrogenase-like predicted oxidoreductase